MKKSLLTSILISLFFINIKSKLCQENKICPDNVDKFKSSNNTINNKHAKLNDNFKYYLSNKNIDFSCDNKKLTLKFEGVAQNKSQEPKYDFRVIYTARFYDKQKLGVDNIQAVVDNEEPIYILPMIKLGNETKDKVEWEINIKENKNREQIVLVTGEASLNENYQTFFYNSFVVKYVKDRNLEFWIIFCCMVGIILITYCVINLIILCMGQEDRPSIKVDDVDPVQNVSARDTFEDNSGTAS